MYHIDENMLNIATAELFEEIRKQKTQKEKDIEFDNGFFKHEEGYKYGVFNKGQKCLNFESWTEDLIGTHVIADNVLNALKLGTNLIYFMNNDFVEKVDVDVKRAERILFDMYKSADEDSDRIAFENFIEYFGKNYSRTAYLFFLKDKEKYLPVMPDLFKTRFEWLNIQTECCNGCTWDHYLEFIQLIKDLRNRIEPYFKHNVSILDTHSFVWCMHLIQKKFEKYESDFRDYSDGQVCVTEEQWKEVLIDEDIFSNEYLELLAKFYFADNHAATCTALAKEDGVHPSHYNPYVASMGKRVSDKLNLPKMYRENGQRYYWPVLFYGRYLLNELFEWQMRPELVMAFESVCQDVLTTVQYKFEEKDARRIDYEALLKKARERSTSKVRSRQTTVEQRDRDNYIAEVSKRRAEGICTLCGEPAPFKDKKGKPFLESHHIDWLSEGGADSIENVVALCPNCHRKMHELKGTPEETDDRKFLKDCVKDYIKKERILYPQ